MISVQPKGFFSYFGVKKNELPKGVGRIFYLSWEDALWDLLDKKKIKKNSLILVPEFYCVDVEVNMKAHGYRIEHYAVDKKLKPDESDFKKKLKKLKPAVIVIFHVVGIKNFLFTKTDWTNLMDDKQILIEDSVHRIVEPVNLKFIRKNHFIMDSLRKVVPLQGSNVYAKLTDLDFVPNKLKLNSYVIKVHLLWMGMLVCWTFGLSKFAEKLMLKGYDLIGDFKTGERGLPLFEFLSSYINYPKIKNLKTAQTETYEKLFRKQNRIKINYTENDKKELRGWPLIIPLKKSEKFLDSLRKQGLMLRYEFDDCLWSQNQKIVYLPMGLHITSNDQKWISKKVIKAINE